jgi:hypothetical protein
MIFCNNLVFFYYSYDKHPLIDRMPMLGIYPQFPELAGRVNDNLEAGLKNIVGYK